MPFNKAKAFQPKGNLTELQRKPPNNQIMESVESSESAWMNQGLEAAENQGPEKISIS